MKNRMLSIELLDDLLVCWTAHQRVNTTDQTTRQNGMVPFCSHPMFGALLLLHDIKLPYELRKLGFRVLMRHDIKEDTGYPLSEANTDPPALRYVDMMTHNTWQEEMDSTPGKPIEVKLFKLIDKISTIMDYDMVTGQGEEKARQWLSYAKQLLKEVQAYYGECDTVVIARAVIDNCNWLKNSEST
ncbi:MAG: hypothetical protein V1838_04730 [Patescibacteria group bacterium]